MTTPNLNLESQEEQNPTQIQTPGGDNSNNNPPESDPNVIEPLPAWQAALFEQNQARIRAEERARQLEEQLTSIRTTNQNPPSPPLEQGDVFNNPERFRQTLLNDMQAQVAPLNATMMEWNRRDQYQQLKTKLKTFYPQYIPILQQLEPALDSVFYSNTNLQPTENNVIDQIKRLVGDIVIAQASQNQFRQPPNQNPPPQVQNQNQMLPPHVRPSNRSVPNTQSQNTSEDQVDESSLTENDRRLMREQKMTAYEFITLRDCPPHEAEKTWKMLQEKRKQRRGGK